MLLGFCMSLSLDALHANDEAASGNKRTTQAFNNWTFRYAFFGFFYGFKMQKHNRKYRACVCLFRAFQAVNSRDVAREKFAR